MRSELRATSTSLTVLREHGKPMTLRDLTSETAKRLSVPLYYADVEAVMASHEQDGDAKRESARNWPDDLWSAT